MYAIVQKIDDFLSVVGKYNRIYRDLNEAIIDWLDIATKWYEEFCKVHTPSNPFDSWTENPPKIMDLSTMQVIYPTRDLREDFIVLYKEGRSQNLANDNEHFEKAKALKEKYNNDVKNLLCS